MQIFGTIGTVSIASIIVLFNTTFPALAAPSFNCQLASTKIEKTICQSSALSKLDKKVAELYKKILKQSTTEERSLIKNEQKEWLEQRDRDCELLESATCLQQIYRVRIATQEAILAAMMTTKSSFGGIEASSSWSKIEGPKVGEAWLLLKRKSSDYFAPKFLKNSKNLQMIFLAIQMANRSVLIGFFTGDSKLLLKASAEVEISMDDIEPSESILSDLSLAGPANRDESQVKLLATYTFNSTSTHCSSTKVITFAIEGLGLKQISDRILKQSCN